MKSRSLACGCRRLLAFLVALVVASASLTLASAQSNPRLIILTDIGGDPDDQQAMVRLMLYCNEFDVEGLIATASGTPGELKERITQPRLIREIVEAYGRVRESLRRHDPRYPPAGQLLAVIKEGNPNRGLEAIGEGKDTEGSRWIIECADRADPRPLNIAIWGGQTDLAQALWRVRRERGDPGLAEFIAKLRVFDIDDQDHIQSWIFEQFPDLFYVLSKAPKGQDKREGAYRGMYLGGDESLTSREWIDQNLRTAHGPLGALYPPKTWTAPNPHGALKEGDTPSWFHFLPNGLGDPAHPEWGGWGGRYLSSSHGLFRDARDQVGDTASARATVWRWRPAFQNEFAARMDWSVLPYEQCNHSPVAVLHQDASRDILRVSARTGDSVELSASGSSDPDGDDLEFSWLVYAEAGTYDGQIELRRVDAAAARFTVPPNAAGAEVHIILEVQDNGTPPLTSFRRVIIRVQMDDTRQIPQ
jgi:hypothetical protein